MKKIISILVLIILSSCGQAGTKNESKKQLESEAINTQLKDTTIQFLWRDMKYDSSLNDSIHSIFINQDYLKTMTAPEKASVGYISTFIGNECWWDGKANNDRSNLDCKIISALGLGYQCSEKHLGFLKKWFSADPQVLSELQKSNCPTIPYTATIQNTFDQISVKTNGDSITVAYEANGINVREQERWTWTEADYFILKDQSLKLIKKDTSEIDRRTFKLR